MVDRIVGLAQHAVPAAGRGAIALGGGGVAEPLVRALLVIDALKGAEAVELLAQAHGRRRGGVLEQGQMHALVSSVLLRLAGRDPLRLNPALITRTERRDSPPTPIEANGEPLSERSLSGRPNSRNAASSTAQTCSPSVLASAWQRNK